MIICIHKLANSASDTVAGKKMFNCPVFQVVTASWEARQRVALVMTVLEAGFLLLSAYTSESSVVGEA